MVTGESKVLDQCLRLRAERASGVFPPTVASERAIATAAWGF